MTCRVVVGISGASGAGLGLRILEILAEAGSIETHLVVSKAGRQTLRHELGPQGLRRAEALAGVVHPVGAIGSTIASGSFRTDGMIVAPCSVRTLSAISYCLSDNLLTRAADVHLKERRPLVLLVRESDERREAADWYAVCFFAGDANAILRRRPSLSRYIGTVAYDSDQGQRLRRKWGL